MRQAVIPTAQIDIRTNLSKESAMDFPFRFLQVCSNSFPLKYRFDSPARRASNSTTKKTASEEAVAA
jgi:hypothetical protein